MGEFGTYTVSHCICESSKPHTSTPHTSTTHADADADADADAMYATRNAKSSHMRTEKR